MLVGHQVVVDGVDPQRLQPQPDGADGKPADEAEDDGALEHRRERQQFVYDGAAEVEREPVDRCAENRADHQRDQSAGRSPSRGHYRACGEHHPGGDKAERPGRRDQHRLEHLAELGDAEVELDLEHRKADDAAEAEVSDAFQEDAVLGAVLAHRPITLIFEQQRRDGREPGAADHHQVGRAPQGDVLAEDARCQTSSSGNRSARRSPQPAIRMPPTGAYQSLVIGSQTGRASRRAG